MNEPQKVTVTLGVDASEALASLSGVADPSSLTHAVVKHAFLDGVAFATACEVTDPEAAWETSLAKARLDAYAAIAVRFAATRSKKL